MVQLGTQHPTLPFRDRDTPPGTRWFGWYRETRRHRWVKLSESSDYGGALNALLDAVAKLSGHAELLVSESDPNQDRSQP